ncbi:MAG: diacylglycerol kinase [Agarilytica sp.]
MIEKNRGFTRLYKSVYYSYKGFRACFFNEAAFRQEVISALVLIPLAFWLPVTDMERVAMITVVVLVLIVELLNSGIEAVVDRIGYEKHELAGRAKDMGSAAVLISLILWAYVWGSILFL